MRGQILKSSPAKAQRRNVRRHSCPVFFVASLRLWGKFLFSRFTTDAAVVNGAGKFAWQLEAVVDDIFEVDTRCTSIGKQRHQGRLTFVLLVLGNAAVVHRVAESE